MHERQNDMTTQAPDVEQTARALLETLETITEAYSGIESALELREESVRTADVAGLVAGLKQENLLVQGVAEAEKRRIALVSAFVDVFGEPPTRERTVSWIAERVGGELGEKLAEAGAALRETLERVQKRNKVSGVAIASLASHMEGLLRAAAAKLSHTGAYGRRGAVEAGPTVVSALDVTS